MIDEIKLKVGKNKVLCALSGSVDSTVTAVLVHKAIGNNLQCVFVDTVDAEKNEVRDIKKLFMKNFKINLDIINASSFFNKLKRVVDPEKKEK